MTYALKLVDRLRADGLDRHFGYRVRLPAGADVALFRFEEARWTDLHNPSLLLSEADVVKLLAHHAAAGCLLAVFACCCFGCATDGARMRAREFVARTGLEITHGYWPGACADRMRAHYAGAAKRRKVVLP